MKTFIILTIDRLDMEHSFAVEDITVVCSRITSSGRERTFVTTKSIGTPVMVKESYEEIIRQIKMATLFSLN